MEGFLHQIRINEIITTLRIICKTYLKAHEPTSASFASSLFVGIHRLVEKKQPNDKMVVAFKALLTRVWQIGRQVRLTP
jgi:hypothetical protein